MQALETKIIPSADKLARFRRALFLTACAASNRSAELAAIDRNKIVFRQDAVICQLKEGFVFKNQSQFNVPSMIRIPNLPDSSLFPVAAIGKYLSDTQASSEPGLFLHPVSGKSLNAGTLAYFLVKAIKWLLPDALPHAHDVRKLSTTHAFVAGMGPDKIMQAGSWRSTSTFAKKYFVPIVTPSSGSAVLARFRI